MSLSLFAGCLTASAADTAGRFPFVLTYDGTEGTAVDFSWLNDRPAGADSFVTIRDGRFATSKGRLRIWGVNTCFGANFPSHADAEKMAGRLARMGVNGVRVHHHDSADAPRGLWVVGPDGKRAISPDMTERQDYLLDRLHRRGIYVNLNLHVGRTLREAEGFPRADLAYDFRYDKFLLYFMPGMREYFKAFCREYLLHENPYRKLKRADDPAIAMVEITNENSFHTVGARLAPKLTGPYRAEFLRQWNEWLKKKHSDTGALRTAWGGDRGEALGEALVDDPSPARPNSPWKLHREGASYVVLTNQPGPAGSAHAVKIDIRQAAAEVHRQELIRDGLSLREGAWYTLSFDVRADAPRALHVDVSRSGPDNWGSLGYVEQLKLGTAWTNIVRVFQATDTVTNRARLCLKFGGSPAGFTLANVKLQRGGRPVTVTEGQSLEAGTIDIPADHAPAEAKNDLRDFMVDVETGFVREMVDYLKKDLGVKVPVTASQISYHSPAIVASTCDYADIHAYWEHPRFPNKPWDPTDWTIPNTPMERKPGADAMSGRAPWRLLDRPYTMSEWNIPDPGDYAASVVPFALLVPALQDWDGVFFFTYDHSSDKLDTDKVNSYFNFNGQPVKLALLAACSAAFRRGDVEPLVPVVAGSLEKKPRPELVFAAQLGMDPKSCVEPPEPQEPPGLRLATPDDRAVWDATDPKTARVTLNAPATRGAWGLVGGQRLDLGGVRMEVGAVERDYAAIVLTSLDGRPVEKSKRLLLAAVGSAQNTGMEWNEKRTSVSNRWGQGPVQVNGVPATVTLPGGPRRVFPLDNLGKRQKELAVETKGGTTVFSIGPEARTLWYEISGGAGAE